MRRKPRQRQKRATKNEVPDAKTDTPDNTSSRPTRKQMAAGKARGTGINVAQRQRFASVFVTGFTADVEAVQIREHVETCTGLKVEVVKLLTKHDTYTVHSTSRRHVKTRTSSWTMICGQKVSDTDGLNLRVLPKADHNDEVKVV